MNLNIEKIKKKIQNYKKNLVLSNKKGIYGSSAYCSGAIAELTKVINGEYNE